MITLALSWDDWCRIADKVIANEDPNQDRLVNGKPVIKVYLTTTPAWRYCNIQHTTVEFVGGQRTFHPADSDKLGTLTEDLLAKTWPNVEFIL